MKYISTRGGVPELGFCDAVLMGLASDGGLLIPSNLPDFSANLSQWMSMKYIDLAEEIMEHFTDLPAGELRKILEKSYSTFDHAEITPVVQVGDINVLELFHGPTLAFKDVALQFLGNVFEYILAKNDRHLNILGATSGDTGSAAIHGVKGRKRIRIFIMHPHGRTSKTQELQMTTVLDSNVFNIAVDGTFDDCQSIMKSIFNDLQYKEMYSLGSINSINWARLLPQIVYYYYGAFRVMERTGAKYVDFAVPTGNFGDIFAGYMAGRMGLPVRRLVLASNENDILSRFFNTGEYSLGKVHATISPSMDIQVASNFERYLYYKLGEDGQAVRRNMKAFAQSGKIEIGMESGNNTVDELFAAGSCDTSATLETIRKYYTEYNYLLDPHTAVGVNVGCDHCSSDVPMICLATAHPAKFSQAVIDAVGSDVARHPFIDALEGLPARCEIMPASEEQIKKYIENACS